MDNCLSSCCCVDNLFKRKQFRSRPIDTTFKLPVAPNAWPPGSGFANGIIDLGGLQVSQVSTFNKVWATYDGGPDNQGATIFEPTGIPQGFSMLGCYSQPNNKPLFGYVLVAKDVSSSTTNSTLKKPIDYTLVLNTSTIKVNQDTTCYIWLPIAPDGYKALGHVVTATQDKPSLDKIMCVRSDLTDQCESSSWIWGSNDFNFYDVRPINRGTQAPGVHVGAFVAQNGGTNIPPSISCLKNLNSISKIMPNLVQIDAILKVYSPLMYLHPDEEYLPSSVNWFFSNGALLYKKGEESNPVPIAQNGINLPQDPNNDGIYWLDLPSDDANKERVKKGNLQSAESYVHVKPMLGGTFTDIAMWIFYPFNGPGRAKVKFINVKLGKIGEHIGDWEHVTLRVSNLDGKLWHLYFSQHSKGEWIDSSQLEFQSNRPVFYSSLHGHASYPHEGLVLQGKNGIGIRNDSAKSEMILDLTKFVLISADYLGSFVIEPPWLHYFRKWGPKIDYNIDEELRKVEKILPGKLKDIFENIIRSLPEEVLGEEGPTGPKLKNNWSGDEV
ncbi:putative vacuolar protein sorting-associated protein [Medicago truncatula]|uniref:DUF946 family protein n=1 Tax=Medicago truncatula TaxID=3880 RepID=G7IQP7_MEDTR|nr:uncharacterized protein LOC11421901 [Medicago truncatula]AES66093.2 DUF946 family protein [Medicago truncatula]RHN74339.1 putative vacuolar protein sorting-associated protein [Medicago truncatula]